MLCVVNVVNLVGYLSINNYNLSDSSQVINVSNNQIVCLQSEIFFRREEIKEKSNLLKLIIKSQPSIKHESKPGNSAGHRNFDNLLTVDKNSVHSVKTDINPDSNTETNKNISSEQSDATLPLIPVSRGKHVIESAKTETLISSSTTTTQTTAKLTPVSNTNSDVVHTADTNNDATTIRNSNESHNTNKSKQYAFLIGASMLKKTDGYLLTHSINHKFVLKTRSSLQLKWKI